MTIRSLLLAGLTLALLTSCASNPSRKEQENSVPQKESITQSTPLPDDSTSTTSSSEPSIDPKSDQVASLDPYPDKTSSPQITSTTKTPLSIEDREQLVNQFMEASILEERNRFDEAGQAYSKALELVPQSSYLGAMTSRAYLQSGNPDEAIRIAEEAVRSGTEEIEAYRVLGLAYRQKKEMDKAIEQYQKILAIQPNSVDTLNELVALYVRSRRFEEAIEIYEKLAHLDSYQSYMYNYRIALILTQMGRFQDALDKYKETAKEIPTNFDVHLRIGKLYEILNQPDEAILTYLTALQHIRNTRDDLSVRTALAPLYFNRKSYREAIYQYNKIKELAPEEFQNWFPLARIYLEQNQYSDALREIDELIQKDPESFYFQVLRFQVLEKLQRTAEGCQGFLSGLNTSIQSGNWDNVQRYLVELTRKGTLLKIEAHAQLPSMRQLLEKCTEKFPDQPRILFVNTKIDLLRNDDPSLQQHIHSILSTMEKTRTDKQEELLSQVLYELRSWYDVRRKISTGDLSDLFIAELNECAIVFPDNPDIYRTLAHFYMDTDRWTDSETELLRAKSLIQLYDPDYKDLIYQLAMVYDKLERVGDIEALLNEAIQQFPEDSQAYNFLGYTYAERNIRLDEAVNLIQKALKLNPDDGNILDSMGWVYFRMGRIQDAIGYLEQAAIHEENHPVILNHLGDARMQQGDIEAAIHCWKQALDNGPDFPYDFTPAFQKQVLQKIQEAENKQIP